MLPATAYIEFMFLGDASKFIRNQKRREDTKLLAE